jgi:hypothetical protein
MFDDSTRKQKQWLDTTIYICIHILVNNDYAIGYVWFTSTAWWSQTLFTTYSTNEMG